MSFNDFIDRNYLITNPLDSKFNLEEKVKGNIDFYHVHHYGSVKPKYEFKIDYKPDMNTIHKINSNEQKEE